MAHDIDKAIVDEKEITVTNAETKKGARFWLIFLSLTLSVFVSALELTSVPNALPVIVDELHGSDFSWVGAAYSLASTAFLPMTGGLAEIFGRRPVVLFALCLFILGSALCGSAKTMGWLIGGRTVQGLGGGAILSSSAIIVSDLVSLQERGAYNGLLAIAWAFALAIGGLVGGGLASGSRWRWLFYLNIPICGLAILLVLLFLHLPTPQGTLREKLARMDWIGNALVMGSTTAVVLALTWAGTEYPWSSAQVIAPLVLGLLGLVFFVVYEAMWAKNPIVPWTILSKRSSASGYIQNFITWVVVLAISYYLPAYFQACKDASPVRSAIDLFGCAFGVAPFAIIGGVSVTITKRYRPQIWACWMFLVTGMAVFSTVGADTLLVRPVIASTLLGIATGALGSLLYFPVLAPLPVTENAHALAFFSFGRSFAGVWGISIGAAVLQNQLGKRLPQGFVEQVGGAKGANLIYSVIPLIRTMEEPLKDEVRDAFGGSIAVVWQVVTGLVGIGIIASLFMPDLPLPNLRDTRWELEQPLETSTVDTIA